MSHKRLSLTRLESHSPGDACGCAKCKGRLKVLNTEPLPSAGVRVWYLGCNLCGERPENNKVVVPLQYFPKRG
jgi:hypothetical protein